MSDSRKYFLTTSRLGFRCWHEDDLPLALGLWRGFEVTKYLDARDRLSTRQVLDHLGERKGNRESIRCAVLAAPFLLAMVKHLGWCGLRPYDSSNREFYSPTDLEHPSCLRNAEKFAVGKPAAQAGTD